MKIFYASQSFYPNIGGVSTYLLNLAKEMSNKGNEVTEVHLRPSGELPTAEIKGITIHRVPKEPIDAEIMQGYSTFKETVYKECLSNIKEFTQDCEQIEGYEDFNKVNQYFGDQLRVLLEQDTPDIVHIHDFQLLFSYKYVPRGIPCILTWHIPFIADMSKALGDFLVKHLSEYDKVIFSSPEYIEAAVKAGLDREKTKLIYPIANTELFKPRSVDSAEVKKKYGIPINAKIILSVTRVDPKSGLKQLISALPKILEKEPNTVLVFVGGDSMSNKLSNSRQQLKQEILDLIVQLDLQDNVIWTGTIDYFNLPELYNSVDVVALCSKNEGFGLAVTEGMACGNPVVGTNVGGIPLQVKDGENGYLVRVGDVNQTADCILNILSNEALHDAMSKRSLEIVEEKFKLEAGITKHAVLYNELKGLKDDFHKIRYLNADDVKGIITDLDGTITDGSSKPQFDPTDYDAGLMKQLGDLEMDLFLATGRDITYVKDLVQHFKVWRAVIAENGAIVYFTLTKKTITVDSEDMKKARKIVSNMNLKSCTVGEVLVSIRKEDEDLVKNKLGDLAIDLNFITNIDEVMVLPKGVDKGMGVCLAMRYLDVDMEETVVIGDGENDIDMFLNPGFKVALLNAVPKLKQLANQVSEQPSFAGVKEILKALDS